MPCEKELAIYGGVLRLLAQGADIYALKVSDIAAAAGIGKGTLYNYFSSKEDIILSTIRYTMEEHLEQLRQALSQEPAFPGKVQAALRYEICHHSRHSQTLFLLSYFGAKGIPPEFPNHGALFPDLQQETISLILETTALGQQEGILGDYSQEEILMAFTGVFSALSLRLCGEPNLAVESPEPLVKLYYQFLVRALAP